MTKISRSRLDTCDPQLQRLVEAMEGAYPKLAVLCGHRNKADQDAAVAGGFSKTVWPTSKHNSLPSRAVDLAPVTPVDWNNEAAFKKLGADVKLKAQELGIQIRWGGDFKSFKDYPHFELT